MERIESGNGIADLGAVEKKAREYLDGLLKPRELEVVDHPTDYGAPISVVTGYKPESVDNSISKADIAELIYAEWSSASDKHFPWWIQSAADKIVARLENR